MSMLAWVVGHGRRAEEMEAGDRGEEREGIKKGGEGETEGECGEREGESRREEERKEGWDREREGKGGRKEEREGKVEGRSGEIKSRAGAGGAGNLENGLGEPDRKRALSKPLVFKDSQKCHLPNFLPSGWFSVFMRSRLLAQKTSALCEKRHLLLKICGWRHSPGSQNS